MLAISDTGAGMSREVMDRACDPFFTTKPEGLGTGLGLSMAYGFVKQTGGHFKIYSEVGLGTSIKLYFPRSHEAVVELPSNASEPVVGGSETILVVEDDPAVQATAVEMLRDLGYRVLKADNAEGALGILKCGLPFDLLFTDVVMPGGLRSPELARQAKALHPKIEVLFTSGYTQNAIVHGGRLDPGVHLLTKPYRREQLARKIRQLLANRQQAALAAKPAGSYPAASYPVDAPVALPKKWQVLVVEDDSELRQMACEFIAVLGHEARGAASAEEALQQVRERGFDLLFADVSLPGMSGIELARRIRRERPALQVIFATGYGGAMEVGADFQHVVLAKPYRLASLKQAFEQIGKLVAAG
jgi:CheY-like chemotaxis protein